tara:strand:+ start:638 stop:895 length:258 start_codon:yes stop_codon:yes gene_type:complete
VPDITRNDLATVYGLSEIEIDSLDKESQNILGKTIMMIDVALRDEDEDCSSRIETALNFIHMAMTLIEENLESMVNSKIPKEQLN